MGSNPTLSASLCKKLLEIGAFSFLQPSLPARLPIHLQRSILCDLLPNPALHLGGQPLGIMGVTTTPFGAAVGAYMQVPAGRRYAVILSRSCQRTERGVRFRLTGPQGDGTGARGGGTLLLCRRDCPDSAIRQRHAVQCIRPLRADRRDRPLNFVQAASRRLCRASVERYATGWSRSSRLFRGLFTARVTR